MHVAWGACPSETPSLPKERLIILQVLAAAFDHPGLFLGDGVGQGRAVEHGLPCVARAVVNPDLNVVGRRREWLRTADDPQTAVVARLCGGGRYVGYASFSPDFGHFLAACAT